MSRSSGRTKSIPLHTCKRCKRLVRLRDSMNQTHPDYWNAPVPDFGDPEAWLLIVGLAPGKEGANRTGIPFTGDASGELLFQTLGTLGLNGSALAPESGNNLLKGAAITNAVKCLPPENRPTGAEISNCQSHLRASIATLPRLSILLALGRIAHQAIIRSYGAKQADHKFAHGAVHNLGGGITLLDSYHCSRYNINTKRLTPMMFEQVFRKAMEIKNAADPA